MHGGGIYPIAGVDEAGRGPLAGPVVACAVVLPPGLSVEGVYDSKKINPLKRGELAKQIKLSALAYGFGVMDAQTIDRVNILQATLLAMQEAVLSAQAMLNTPIRAALVDGNRSPKLPCPVLLIVKGDSRCHSIAAASILAKEARDTIMRELDCSYPRYGFAENKGYPTPAHVQALKKYGPCPEHRLTFKKVVN